MPRNANIIGRNVAKFRYQAGWTQEFLAARMQLLGCYISRDIIANIEHRLTFRVVSGLHDLSGLAFVGGAQAGAFAGRGIHAIEFVSPNATTG
jgi:transcriptional regulator with XRE-family HTH domain